MMAVFKPEDYELEKLKITELTNTKKYYAKVDDNTVKIYTVAPAAGAVTTQSLFEIVDENKTYELSNDATPDDAVPFYVIMELLDGYDQYKVSDNFYILPSLTPEKIESKVVKNKDVVEKLEQEKVAEEQRLKNEADKLAAEKAEQERLAKDEADKLAEEKVAEEQRLKNEADKLAAEKAEQERLAKDEADKLAEEKVAEEQRLKNEADKLAAEKAAEQERLAKNEADKLAAEKAAEQERLAKDDAEKAEEQRLAKVEADKLAAEKAAEQERLAKNDADKLPPSPPSKEEEETARITNLLQAYRQNIKKADYIKGLPNSTTTSSGLSQTNACYINAMLQMLIDIDEFLEYILFMNETKKQQELAKLIKDANALVENFSNIVGVTEKLPEFLIFVYNVIKTDAQSECNDNNCINEIIEFMKPTNSNVDSQILMVQNIIQMFGFPTSEDTSKPKNPDDSYPRYLTREFKNNSNEDIILVSDDKSVFDYDKYIDFGKNFGVSNYNENDYNNLKIETTEQLPSPLKCLSDLKDNLVKIKEFENKHQIITALKYIFEFVINGISLTEDTKDKVIIQVNNVQRLINLTKSKQEDASAVYSLLNVKFDDELIQRYGLVVKNKINGDNNDISESFLSPVNLPANNNTPLSVVIKDNVSMKEENKDIQRYIIFGNPQSSNNFDQITLQEKTFKPIGIVKHIGDYSNIGSMGGHYLYYSLKSNKLLNDDSVTINNLNMNTPHTRTLVLYERIETTPGGSSGKTPTKFRASRRKQIKKASSI